MHTSFAIMAFATIFALYSLMLWWTISRMADGVDSVAHQLKKIVDIIETEK